MGLQCLMIAVLGSTLTVAPDNELDNSTSMSRGEFAKAISTIKGGGGLEQGTPTREALRILGKPDDILTRQDSGVETIAGVKEIWCYGTKGPHAFPTLGCVYFDMNDRALYVYGGRGTPPPSNLFKEEELAELLRVIDEAPALDGKRYDPLTIVQIVNRLQPLGKEKALAVVDEYLRVASSFRDAREGLFLVLRVLFEVPETPGHMPSMRVGYSYPQPPQDPKLIPRFPILIMDDVPLMLVSGYELTGVAQPVEEHVAYFRKHGRLRAKPLSLPRTPLQIFEAFEKQSLWLFDKEPKSYWLINGKLMIINQLLRLVDSVYRLETDVDGYKFSETTILDKHWRWLVNDFSKLDIQWSENLNKYTFKDGSSLP